jgi:hypothetical protein
MKHEKNELKREDKSRALQRLELIGEYKKEKNIETLREKSERAEEIKFIKKFNKENKKQKCF